MEEHGDEGLIEITDRDMEVALEQVVETIIMFGQWPQPSRSTLYERRNNIKPFDLVDFMMDRNTIEFSDLVEFIVAGFSDYSLGGYFSDLRYRYEKKVTDVLMAHLKDSDIVREQAIKNIREEREDQEAA